MMPWSAPGGSPRGAAAGCPGAPSDLTVPPPDPAEGVARNALFKVAVHATRLLSLGLVIVAARVLGPVAFGKFTFAYALATFLGVALDCGIPVILTREIARAPAAAAARFAAAARLKLLVLGPAALALALVPVVTHRPWDTTGAVWLLALALALQSFVENAVAVFTGFQRLEYELIVRVVEKLVLVAVGLSALGLGAGLLGVTGAFVAAAGVSLALATLIVRRRLVSRGGAGAGADALALARTVGPVALAYLLHFAAARLTPLAVALLAGDRAAGYFGAAFRVLDVVQVLPVALVAAVYPVLARTPLAAGRFREVQTQAAELLLLVALAVGLALGTGAAAITRIVYGESYGPAALVLAWLAPGIGLAMLQHYLGVVLLAVDRPGRLLAVAAVGASASAVLTPVLVWWGGAVGGAVAVTLVELVTVGASLGALRSAAGWPFGRGAAKGLAAAAAALIVAGWVDDPGRLGVALAVYGVGLVLLRPIPARILGALWRGAMELPAALAAASRR